MTTTTQQQKLVTQCVGCFRVFDGKRWVGKFDGLIQVYNGMPVSHGFCPTCGAEAIAKAKAIVKNVGGETNR